MPRTKVSFRMTLKDSNAVAEGQLRKKGREETISHEKTLCWSKKHERAMQKHEKYGDTCPVREAPLAISYCSHYPHVHQHIVKTEKVNLQLVAATVL